MKYIRYYKKIYWFICLAYFGLTNSYRQFSNIASNLLVHRFGYKYEQVNTLTIIPPLVMMCSTPFIHKLIESHGKKPFILLAASIYFIIAYLGLYLLPAEPNEAIYLLLVFIGLAYSVVQSSLFSTVAIAVPKAGISMAFALVTLFEDIGLTIFPLIFGKLQEGRSVSAYDECLLGLIALSILSLVFTSAMILYDTNSSRILTLPAKSRRVQQMRRKIDSEFVERSMRESMDYQFNMVKSLTVQPQRHAKRKIISFHS